jgi:hypothetical protein
MSITSLNKTFNKKFTNFIICDFVIDSDDAKKMFDSSMYTFNFEEPTIKINIIKFDDDKHHRISSFILYDKELKENNWELIEKIEIDNCQVLILPEDIINSELDDWLESNIKMNELYKIEDDGRICLLSGFGPGVYRLMGIKNNDKYTSLKMEFIKENE